MLNASRHVFHLLGPAFFCGLFAIAFSVQLNRG
jgi:hypothetical protein